MTFTGYLSGDELMAALSAFDIGIIPDPLNPYNDKISMNKVFEYSALGDSLGRLSALRDPAPARFDRPLRRRRDAGKGWRARA